LVTFPFRYLWWLFTSARRAFRRPPEFVVFLLEGELPPLRDPPRPLWQRLISRPRLSLQELGERFEAVGHDPRIKGVVLHLRPLGLSLAAIEDLREHVAGLRHAGKRVVAWAPSYTTATYYCACACDEILIMPTGMVAPLGLSGTGMFLAEGLARLGIKADFVQVSPYKTAADSLTRSTMSPEYREQVTWLLEAQHAELVDAIAKGRALSPEAASELIDRSPYLDGQALAGHVVDGILGEEELAPHLGAAAAGSATLGTWEVAQRALHKAPPRLGRGRYVALLRIEGTIVDGRSGRPPATPPIDIPILGENRAGDLTVVQAARQAASDRRAAAAVLYINSRGGSSTASEAMRQALALVAARKPLVVVMGPVAGSGGYLVATPGSWIVARRSTLTGSIGVLTGKIVTSSLFEKLQVNRETISVGRHATLESDERGYSDEERRIVADAVDGIYLSFLEVVARARGMAIEEVRPVAGGRVWSGRQALERRLVDELGGLAAGTSKARALAGLAADAPLREVRAPKHAAPPPSGLVAKGGWLDYVIEGLGLLSRAPSLTLMQYLPPRLR